MIHVNHVKQSRESHDSRESFYPFIQHQKRPHNRRDPKPRRDRQTGNQHECEEMRAMLRRKIGEKWTDKHRHCDAKACCGRRMGAEQIVRHWLVRRKRKCRRCNKEEGTEKHRPYHCPCWREIRSQLSEELRKWKQRARTSKREWKWQRGVVTHPPSDSQWVKSHSSVQKMGM